MPVRVLVLLLLVGSGPLLYAQASPTASRAGDLQIGAGFAFAKPDYTDLTFKGLALYGDFDFNDHVGVEAEFHEVSTPDSTKLYEKTYEIGGRYFRTYGRLVPYGKIMIGRGVFNYAEDSANLAYNMFALGAGADFKATSYLHVRADYEYQHWSSFPPNGLTPQLFTIGVAYHFRGERRP